FSVSECGAILALWIDNSQNVASSQSVGRHANHGIIRHQAVNTPERACTVQDRADAAEPQRLLSRRSGQRHVEGAALATVRIEAPDTAAVAIEERVRVIAGEWNRGLVCPGSSRVE